MKVLKSIAFCILILTPLSIFCQNEKPAAAAYTISILVKEAVSNKALSGATVSFKNNSGIQVKSITADSLGSITTVLPQATYTVQASFTGYTSVLKKYTVNDFNNTGFLKDTVALIPLMQTMQQVTVTGTKQLVENKADRLVYNVDKDVTSQSGVAADVLRKIPQITVDVNGNVELLGNPSVQFLINGKPSTVFGSSIADALQSIPATQIERVEVMSSPGAKYDAGGTGGIINIILKKVKAEGFSGIVNTTAGTRLENGSLNLTYKKNNLGLNGYFSGTSQLKTTTENISERFSADTATKNSFYLKQDGSSAFSRFGYRAGVSADWDINKQDNITLSLSYFHFGNNNNGFSNQLNKSYDQSGAAVFTENTLRNVQNKFDNATFETAVEYRRKSKNEKNSIAYSYTYSSSNNTSAYDQGRRYPGVLQIFSGSSSVNPGKDAEHDFSADYSNHTNKNLLLETGIKFTTETITSNSDVYSYSPAASGFVFDDKQSYKSKFSRQVAAAYVSGGFTLFTSLQVTAGARLEHTFNTASYSKNPGIVIPGYNNWGPAINLFRKMSNRQSLKFSYAYRLERPEYKDLNPFVNLADPHNVTTGNPYMVPEVGNDFQLGYNKIFGKDNNLNIVFVYTYNSPDIKSYTSFYSFYKVGDSLYENVNVTMRGNIAAEHRWGTNISTTLAVVKGLNVRFNLQLYDRTTKNIYSNPVIVNGFEYRGNANINFTAGQGFIAEAFGNYNSGIRWQGRRAAFSSYTISLRKQLFNERAAVGITAVNAFGKYLVQKSTQYGSGFNGTTTLKIPYRSVGISFMYKFGKIKISKPKEEENLLTKPPVEN